MQLTSENVHKTFIDCLYKEGEDTTGHIKAAGIMATVGFHPERLLENTLAIRTMLELLPIEFYKETGSGMSFLNFVNNRDGEQWTDLHQIADELLMLGLAINKIEYNMPRALWQSLPSGMPYLFIK